MRRCGEVRLADCRGTHEEHLKPGEGTIDFPAMFAAIEASGYRGHYMQAFGSLDDMLEGREASRAAGKGGSQVKRIGWLSLMRLVALFPARASSRTTSSA